MLGLTIFTLLAVAILWVGYTFFKYISAIPKELGAALIAAAATTIVATLTIMIGRYFERKKELDALYRDKKTEIYDEFLKEFFSIFFNTAEIKGIGVKPCIVIYERYSQIKF